MSQCASIDPPQLFQFSLSPLIFSIIPPEGPQKFLQDQTTTMLSMQPESSKVFELLLWLREFRKKQKLSQSDIRRSQRRRKDFLMEGNLCCAARRTVLVIHKNYCHVHQCKRKPSIIRALYKLGTFNQKAGLRNANSLSAFLFCLFLLGDSTHGYKCYIHLTKHTMCCS